MRNMLATLLAILSLLFITSPTAAQTCSFGTRYHDLHICGLNPGSRNRDPQARTMENFGYKGQPGKGIRPKTVYTSGENAEGVRKALVPRDNAIVDLDKRVSNLEGSGTVTVTPAPVVVAPVTPVAPPRVVRDPATGTITINIGGNTVVVNPGQPMPSAPGFTPAPAGTLIPEPGTAAPTDPPTGYQFAPPGAYQWNGRAWVPVAPGTVLVPETPGTPAAPPPGLVPAPPVVTPAPTTPSPVAPTAPPATTPGLPAAPPDTEAPTAPGDLSAVPDEDVVTLEWGESIDTVGVDKYIVYRDRRKIKDLSGSDTEYIDYSARPGKRRYHVVAVDKAGNKSDKSDTVEAIVTAAVAPPATRTDPGPSAPGEEGSRSTPGDKKDDTAHSGFPGWVTSLLIFTLIAGLVGTCVGIPALLIARCARTNAAAAQTTATTVQKEVTDARQGKPDLLTNIGGLRTDFDVLSTAINHPATGLAKQIGDAVTKLHHLETTVLPTMEGRVTDAHNLIGTLQSDLTAIQTELVAARHGAVDLATLTARIQVLDDAVNNPDPTKGLIAGLDEINATVVTLIQTVYTGDPAVTPPVPPLTSMPGIIAGIESRLTAAGVAGF